MQIPNRNFFKHITARALDLVLPPRCPMTGALVGQNGTVSPQFWSQLNFIHDTYCHSCGAPFRHAIDGAVLCAACLQEPPPYSRARAVMRYDDHSAGMILKFKHADGTTLVPVLGGWMLRTGTELLEQSDIIIPVPLHRWRLFKRRYNQAALLSAYLSTHSGVAHAPHALRRKRQTESQGQKTKTQRAENIRNAFVVTENQKDLLKGKRVLLVDDVYTSGATVNECTKALLAAGATQVNVLTIARAGFGN